MPWCDAVPLQLVHYTCVPIFTGMLVLALYVIQTFPLDSVEEEKLGRVSCIGDAKLGPDEDRVDTRHMANRSEQGPTALNRFARYLA